tara:strand:- start:2762 stop:3769 length:1008 start_codon:yes stop_codon:yes gene_type:complete
LARLKEAKTFILHAMRYHVKHESLQAFLNPFTLRISAILSLFSPRKIPLATTLEKKGESPFFLIGSGRSGTTLLRTILNQHPDICIPPESHGAIPNAVKQYYIGGESGWQRLISLSIGEFLRHTNFKLWKTDLQKNISELYELSPEKQSLRSIIDYIYQEYIKKHKIGASRWGDKTPFNTLRLKWILKLYPNAKFVFVLRDPRAVASSFRKSEINPHLHESALRWKASIKAFEKLGQNSKSNTLLLKYEDLVMEPEAIIRKVCLFLNIEFQTTMLTERRAFSGDGTIAHHKNSQRKINRTSLEKWREFLSKEEIKNIESITGSLLTNYGYSKFEQ